MTDQLVVANASKRFGGVIANQDISLSVPDGSIVGLIGPNGSGKTTLFNSIVGYHPTDGGSIRFEGREITKLRVPQIARLGMIRTFQQTRVFSKMTCMQNMAISDREGESGILDLMAKVKPEVDERAEALLDFCGLYLQAPPHGRRPLLRPAEAA